MNLYFIIYTIGFAVCGYPTIGGDIDEVLKRESKNISKEYGDLVQQITIKPINRVDGYDVGLKKCKPDPYPAVFGCEI